MESYIVVSKLKDWPIHIPGVQVCLAKDYLAQPDLFQKKRTRIYNFSRSYKYQTVGYYISLLAEARGHKVLPTLTNLLDIKYQALAKIVTSDLQELINKSFSKIHSDEFTLSIYFGENLAERHNEIAKKLFVIFQAPLLRAYFVKENNTWLFQSIETLSISSVPDTHKEFLYKAAQHYFHKTRHLKAKKAVYKYDLAILYNEDEPSPPSDQKAISHFIKAGQALGVDVEVIKKEDFAELNKFDALFIRDTTKVNHYTYRFARKAQNEGLAVIDDPLSILRCTNKVYLSEILRINKIPTPKTQIVSTENDMLEAAEEMGFPCVLKQPDSAFSQGVMKVSDRNELELVMKDLLKKSDLIIMQQFVPTHFDWRIGVLDRKPLYACQYFMAKDHWQIMNWSKKNKNRYGDHQTVGLDQVPKNVIDLAVKAAGLIGDGLYGVDVKVLGDQPYIIEINDNPSIDAGCEDEILKESLYEMIIQSFIRRIETVKNESF